MLDGIYFPAAMLDGYIRQQSAAIVLTGNQSATIDFELALVGTLNNSFSGKVQNAQTGEFVSGALVSLEQNNTVAYTQTTGAEGDFAFTDIAVGQYQVIVQADSFAGSPFISLFFDVNTRINDFYIQLQPLSAGGNASLSGTVRDAQTAQLLFPAFIRLFGNTPAGDSLFYLAETLPDGTYEIPVMQAGVYYASVFSPGYHPLFEGPLTVEEGANTRDFLLEEDFVSVSGTVSGTVTQDTSGAPVANAIIEFLALDGSLVIRGFTGPLGNYTTAVQPGDYYVAVQIGSDSLGGILYREYYDNAGSIANATAITVTENQVTAGIDFGIPDSIAGQGIARLSGIVFSNDPAGAVVHPAFIQLASIDPPNGIVQFTINNPDGSYAFENLVPGTYQVSSQVTGFQPYDNFAVTIKPGDNTFDILMSPLFTGPTGTISGQVTFDGSGNPVTDALIEFLSSDVNIVVQSDVQGNFSANLPEGDYYIACTFISVDSVNILPLIYREFYDNVMSISEATLVTVTAGDTVTGINFGIPDSLPPATATISGTVTDDNGTPIEGARVTVETNFFFPSGDSLVFQTLTDAQGAYSIEMNSGLQPFNAFIVSAGKSGHRTEYWNEQPARYLADMIFVYSDTTIQNVDFTLSPNNGGSVNSISGTVFSANGVAQSAFVVGANMATGELVFTFTDSSGSYSLDGLGADPHIVLFAADGHVPEFYDDALIWEDALPVAAVGSVTGIDATLAPLSSNPANSGMITGTVTDNSGAPVSGVLVTVMNDANVVIGYDFSDGQGGYQLSGIANGNVMLQASKISYNSAQMFGSFSSSTGTMMVMNINLSPVTVGIEELPADNLPQTLTLAQNYPNPFNPETTIEFALPQAQQARLAIYNVLGQMVNELVNRELPAGTYRFTWNGTDSRGNGVTSGIYFYMLDAGGNKQVRKMLLSR